MASLFPCPNSWTHPFNMVEKGDVPQWQHTYYPQLYYDIIQNSAFMHMTDYWNRILNPSSPFVLATHARQSDNPIPQVFRLPNNCPALIPSGGARENLSNGAQCRGQYQNLYLLGNGHHLPEYKHSTIKSTSAKIRDEFSNSKSVKIGKVRRKRRHRTVFTDLQIRCLEEIFSATQYPDVTEREILASKILLKEERIEIWFKNRRAKLRKKKSEFQT